MRSCRSCIAGAAPLKGAALEALRSQLSGWTVEAEHHVVREFRFADFAAALQFVNRIGALAEAEGHHPDIELGWGRVGVKLWTHSAGGLTESDFILAAKIDRLPRA